MNAMSTPIRYALFVTNAAAALLMFYAVSVRAQIPGAPLEELSAFPQTTLTISGGGTSHQFTIWVANTDAREQQGLMFVRELPADKGMVFSGEEPRVWNMWMKNTYIPLDMLFIAPDGHVAKIAHAIPHDESIISSGIAVSAVIELQAGISDKLHLKVGDVVKWKSVPIASNTPRLGTVVGDLAACARLGLMRFVA